MKLNHAIAVVLLALGLAACQKPKQVQPETPQAPTTTTDSGAQTSGLGNEGAGANAGESGMSAAQQQALAALQGRNVIYFEYDSSEIRHDDLQIVAAHAAYLGKYPTTAHARLEGNTDERGSREYNIGLGERRAQTVRKALQLQGVTDAQITTVSYGEERPAAEGSDEAAYAKNRRVEISYAP